MNKIDSSKKGVLASNVSFAYSKIKPFAIHFYRATGSRIKVQKNTVVKLCKNKILANIICK